MICLTTGGAGIVTDEALADALGLPAFIGFPDMADLAAQFFDNPTSLMETKHILNLIDLEKHRLELFRQQTDTLDGLMPMFCVAANLILEEMEPFRKYGREPHLDLSTCSQYIRLYLTVQKKSNKAISNNWINVLYKPDGIGQVTVNADNL